ncbi:MAG: transposase [Candidatus Aenigmatarchaeota archaeon]
MGRFPRLETEEVLYYITNRGNHEQEIFKEEIDYYTFLEFLKKYKEEYKFKLFAFVLMPNHFHLLIELKEETIKKGGVSSIMHDLNTAYTKYFNNKYKRKGHLFSGRFKATIIEKQPYLLRIISYLHLNPQRLNLVSSFSNYPYSSYVFYTEEKPSNLIKEEKREVEEFLEGFSYTHFIEKFAKDLNLELHSVLKKPIVGSKEFEKKIKENLTSFRKEKPKKILSFQKKLGIILVLLTIFSIFIFPFVLKGKKGSLVLEKETVKEIREFLENLEKDNWQIYMVPLEGGQITKDTISFKNGEFFSNSLSLKGLPATSYSLILENEKFIWQATQISQDIKAFWQGEVNGLFMQGNLVLEDKNGNKKKFNFFNLREEK